MSSGASPFANGREAPQASNRSGDTPSSLKQFLRNKLIYNFTKDYATPKIPGAREKPLPATGAEPRPSPVSRYERPEPYKQTLHNRSSAPPWSRAQLAPRPRNNSGTSEPPYYQVQVNISQQFS